MKIKSVSKAEFLSMSNWIRKAWSTRARRWLKLMPPEMLKRNPWADSTKKAVKNWVRENVGIKGEDAILWGKWEVEDLEYERLEEGAYPRPYWSEQQMKRRGEPKRKRMKMDIREEINRSEGEEVAQGGQGRQQGQQG